MIIDFIMLKDRISEMNYMADNMLEERKGHNYIRTCGFYEDFEIKLKKRYPKTFRVCKDKGGLLNKVNKF